MVERMKQLDRRHLVLGAVLTVTLVVLGVTLLTPSRVISAAGSTEIAFDHALRTAGGAEGGIELTDVSSTSSYYSVDVALSEETHGDVITNGAGRLAGQSQVLGTFRYFDELIITGGSNALYQEQIAVPVEMYPLPLGQVFPAVELSNDNANFPTLTSNGQSVFNPVGSLQVKLTGPDELLIPGGTYLVDEWDVAGPFTILVPPGEVVRIYVRGPMKIAGGTQLNPTEGPSHLLLVSNDDGAGGTTVELSGQSEVNARLYVPDGDVHISGGSTLRGAAVARRAELHGNSHAIYDELWLLDETPPVVTFLSPADGAIVNSTTVDVVGEITSNVVVSEAFLVVRGTWTRLELDETGEFTAAVELEEGENLIQVVALGGAALTRASLGTILDLTPPQVYIEAPQDGYTTNDPVVLVRGGASDDRGVGSVTLVVNGVGTPVDLQEAADFALPATLQEGPNTIEVVAVDQGGNSSSTSVAVVVDTYVGDPVADCEDPGTPINGYVSPSTGHGGVITVAVITEDESYQGARSFKLSGDSWAAMDIIGSVYLDPTSSLEVAILIPVGELGTNQGLGITDGTYELLYQLAGTQVFSGDSVVNTHRDNTLADGMWHVLTLPIGQDWAALHNGGQPWPESEAPSLTQLIFFNETASPGTIYFDEIVIRDELGPAPPTELRAVAGSTDILTSWLETESKDAAGYQVFYSETSDPCGADPTTEAPSIKVSGAEITKLVLTAAEHEITPGTTYYISAQTFDSSGNRSGCTGEVLSTPGPLFGAGQSVGDLACAAASVGTVADFNGDGFPDLALTGDDNPCGCSWDPSQPCDLKGYIAATKLWIATGGPSGSLESSGQPIYDHKGSEPWDLVVEYDPDSGAPILISSESDFLAPPVQSAELVAIEDVLGASPIITSCFPRDTFAAELSAVEWGLQAGRSLSVTKLNPTFFLPQVDYDLYDAYSAPGDWTCSGDELMEGVTGYRSPSVWVDLGGDGYPEFATFSGRGVLHNPTLWIVPNVDGVPGTPVAQVVVGSDPADLAAGDVNSDGRMDLVATRYGGYVTLFENLGGYQFEEHSVASLGGNAYFSVELADVTGDGWLDIVLGFPAGVPDAPLANLVLVGDGRGSFLPAGTQLGAGGGLLVDIDQDSDLDFVAGSDPGQLAGLSVFSGTVSARVGQPTLAGPLSVDIDPEGDYVVFSWPEGQDDTTPARSLTYSFALGTSSGAHDLLGGPVGALGLTSDFGVLGPLGTGTEEVLRVPVAAIGEHQQELHVSVQVVDNGFVRSDSIDAVFWNDWEPPTLSIDAPGTPCVTESPLVEIGFSDAFPSSGLSLSTFQVLLDGTTDITGEFTVSDSAAVAQLSDTLPAGAHSLNVEIVDNSGKQSVADASFVIDPGGAGIPTVSIESPANDAIISIDPPRIVATFTDSGLCDIVDPDSVRVTVDGEEKTIADGSLRGASGFDGSLVAPLGEGVHTMVVSVRDYVGNEGSATSVFAIDTTLAGAGDPALLVSVPYDTDPLQNAQVTVRVFDSQPARVSFLGYSTFGLLCDRGVDYGDGLGYQTYVTINNHLNFLHSYGAYGATAPINLTRVWAMIPWESNLQQSGSIDLYADANDQIWPFMQPTNSTDGGCTYGEYAPAWAMHWEEPVCGNCGRDPCAPELCSSGAPFAKCKFNLNSFNAAYLDRLETLLQRARDRGIVIHLSLFSHHFFYGAQVFYGDEGCSAEKSAHPWVSSPWNPNNNANGLGSYLSPYTGFGPLNASGTEGFCCIYGGTNPCVPGSTLNSYGVIQRNYVKKIVERTGKYWNVVYEIMNEARYNEADWAPDFDVGSRLKSWHEDVASWILEELAARGYGHRLISANVWGVPNYDDVHNAQGLDVIALHGEQAGMDDGSSSGIPDTLQTFITSYSHPLIVEDDGMWDCPDCVGYPDPAECTTCAVRENTPGNVAPWANVSLRGATSGTSDALASGYAHLDGNDPTLGQRCWQENGGACGSYVGPLVGDFAGRDECARHTLGNTAETVSTALGSVVALPPTPPVQLHYPFGGGGSGREVTLVWTPNSEIDVLGYHIYLVPDDSIDPYTDNVHVAYVPGRGSSRWDNGWLPSPIESGQFFIVAAEENTGSPLLPVRSRTSDISNLLPFRVEERGALSPDQGPETGGTLVTISGLQATNVTSVTFGGVAGTGLGVDNGNITVTTPAHAVGLVDVTVVLVDAHGAVEWHFPQAFEFMSVEVSPALGTTSGGTPITVSGVNLLNGKTGPFKIRLTRGPLGNPLELIDLQATALDAPDGETDAVRSDDTPRHTAGDPVFNYRVQLLDGGSNALVTRTQAFRFANLAYVSVEGLLPTGNSHVFVVDTDTGELLSRSKAGMGYERAQHVAVSSSDPGAPVSKYTLVAQDREHLHSELISSYSKTTTLGGGAQLAGHGLVEGSAPVITFSEELSRVFALGSPNECFDDPPTVYLGPHLTVFRIDSPHPVTGDPIPLLWEPRTDLVGVEPRGVFPREMLVVPGSTADLYYWLITHVVQGTREVKLLAITMFHDAGTDALVIADESNDCEWTFGTVPFGTPLSSVNVPLAYDSEVPRVYLGDPATKRVYYFTPTAIPDPCTSWAGPTDYVDLTVAPGAAQSLSDLAVARVKDAAPADVRRCYVTDPVARLLWVIDAAAQPPVLGDPSSSVNLAQAGLEMNYPRRIAFRSDGRRALVIDGATPAKGAFVWYDIDTDIDRWDQRAGLAGHEVMNFPTGSLPADVSIQVIVE